jgi:hypothetical protein
MTPEEARLRGRIGAFELHARYDPRETTHAARSAFLARFERLVDPEERLDNDERRRRAAAARKAYFARLALLSAQARRAQSKRNAAPMDTMDAATEDGDGPANLQH